MRLKIYIIIVLSVVAGLSVVVLKNNRADAPGKSTASNMPAQTTKPTFNTSRNSLTDPTSIWVIVNKQHPLLPKNYRPADLVTPRVSLRVPGNESMQLRQVTTTALEAMFSAATTDGINLTLASGYRSYDYQVGLYNGYVASQGQATADSQSARPSFSEHQTGLAFDVEPLDRICELELCFGDTPAGKWVAAHAYEYGFIIRYQASKESVTGYDPEPWHVRYIGIDLATEMHRTGIMTLEEFFAVSGGKTYAP